MVGFLRTGSRDLANSAAYPPAFGREVAKLHSESMALWMQLGVLQNNDHVVCEAIQFVTIPNMDRSCYFFDKNAI